MIQRKILDCIRKSNIPLSTRQITLSLKVSWNTVQQHCLKLFIAGKLNKIRTDSSYLWVKPGKYGMKKRSSLDTFSSDNSSVEKQENLMVENLLALELEKQIQQLQKQLLALQQKTQENKITAQFAAGVKKDEE